MFCKNCGKPIFDGDTYCTFCGTPVTGVPGNGGMNGGIPGGMSGAPGGYAGPGPVSPAGKKSGSKAWIFILIGAIVAAIAVGIGIFFFVRLTSYDRPVRALIQGIEKQDGDELLSAIHPEMLDAMLEEEGISKKEAADQIQSMFGSLGVLGDIKIDYEITDAEDLSAADVEDLKEAYQDLEGADIKVDAAKTLEVEFTAMGESQETELTVFKSGFKWYLAF